MTFIKYNENNPFNTQLIEYENELDGMFEGSIKAGQYEVDLINNREALWFKGKLMLIRDARKELLNAFDKYKTNVQYGIIIEDEEMHKYIINWYNNLLDLKDIAFINIPEKIKYYLL